MTAPPATNTPIQSAYTQALLDARATGYALGAEGVARLRAMFGRAIQDLTRELALAGDDQVTIRRATALREQILKTLELIERRIAEITAETARATAEAVVAIHRDANLALVREYRPDLTDQVAASFNVVNVRAVATFAARPAVASTFRTLARRHVQDAAPALDNLLGSSIARGVSSGRLTKDVAALLAGGSPDLKTYGLAPTDVSGLRSLLSDARRIAVTETNNALREGNRQSLLASPIVKAVKWQTSGRHLAIPGLAPDECDELAEGNDPEDLAELGQLPPGYYSPKRFPLAPHPYCACVQGGPTIFYRPSEWARVLGKKPVQPVLEDFEVLVARAIALLDEGKDRRIAFRAMKAEFPGETIERLGQAVTEAELRRSKRPKEKTFEEWVEEATALLRENGFRFGATVIELVNRGASADLAGRATETAMDRLANVEDSEVKARATYYLANRQEVSRIPALLERDFGISPSRALRLTQEALAEARAAVNYAEIEEEARRLSLMGFRESGTLFAKLVERYPLAEEDRVLAIVERVLAERPVDYALIDLAIRDLIGQGERKVLEIHAVIMGRFPKADPGRVRVMIEDILAELAPVDYEEVRRFVVGFFDQDRAATRRELFDAALARFPKADRVRVEEIVEAVLVGASPEIPPHVMSEFRQEAEKLLRQGIERPIVASAIARFALAFRTTTADGRLIDGFVLTGDEADEIVRAVQQKIAAEITDDEIRLLARTLLASGQSGDRVVGIIVRSVLPGGMDRASRIVDEIVQAKAATTAKALEPGRAQAAEARERLATIKAEAEAEVLALHSEKTRLMEQIEALEKLKFDRPRGEFGLLVQTPEERAAITALEQQVRDVRAAEGAITAVRRERAIEAVSVPKHKAGTFNVRTRLPQVREKWERGIDVLRRIVPKEVLDGFMTDLKLKPGRAHYRSGDGAFMDKTDGFTTVVHELGHAIEYYRPEILKQSLAWRDSRTVGEALVRMSKLYPNHGYEAHELTRPDKFLHAYIGKDYGTRASEVLSMGLEEMARDPIGFAENDPDMFDFIFAVLRSVMDANPPKRGRIA